MFAVIFHALLIKKINQNKMVLLHCFLVTLNLLFRSNELNRVLGNLYENLEHVLFLWQ